MRWDELFADLEAQLEAAERAELGAEVADRTRREWARVPWAARLRSAHGCRLVLRVEGAGPLEGELVDSGPGWLLLGSGVRAAVVAAPAVLAVSGLPARSAVEEGEVARRLDLGYVLRGLVRERAALDVVLRDGTVLHGTGDRVGADWLDLAVHPADRARRSGEVRGVQTLPLPALAVVRPG
ncbi:hypothetical protein EV189_1909 [Motilibacter rhizosphaerae]|uniref:Uncharacterized protein n=1 Tax=Motilibacter rhizosphaerae TaxID=598652 RepID=A0A4Q7NSL3_9ACTN|nr:hypothetical protein [Motilibacter rhizosphaerae]RZS90126.1 hypothetical protein EV189_1909 [Motilibacter rhizosphaerae]